MNVIYAPNENGGSGTFSPRMVVIHAMGEFLLDPNPIHATDFLEKLGLSAHALVDPNGDVYITRDDDQGAYHARGYNKESFGIEFLVEGYHTYGTFLEAIKTDWITEAQWDAGIITVKKWISNYHIPREKVVRHFDISPGRKVDPGTGFNWHKFLDEVFA